MTKFESFDRNNLKALSDEMNAVLAKYGMESNLEFSIGGIKFSSTDVEIKVSAKIKGAKTFNDVILESRVKALGLVMEKDDMKLVRYDAKKYKMPFIFEKGGKLFKASEDRIKFLFAA